MQTCANTVKSNGLLRVFILTLSLGEPSEEGFRRLANLLAGCEIDVLFTSLGAPFSDDVFWEYVRIVEGQKDLRSLVIKSSILLPSKTNEPLNASKKSLFMLLRRDQLSACQLKL